MQVNVIVEIPKGSRNKYEYDIKKKVMVFDRMLFSSVHYPCDYGFVEDTLAEDGDPHGLYAKARAGEIPNFTGVSAPFEAPQSPSLVIDTGTENINESVQRLLALV